MEIPEGWKLVPVEPTAEMKSSAEKWATEGFDWPATIYRAMIKAAPAPPAQEDEPVGYVSRRYVEKEYNQDMINREGFPEVEVPVFLRPADDKLRQAAEELLAIADGKGRTDMFERTVEKLRAALERKSTPSNTDKPYHD